MPRSGSIFNEPTQEEVDAWVRQKVEEFERDFIQRLRDGRVKANAKFASASASATAAPTRAQQTIYLNAPISSTPLAAHYIIVSNSDPRKTYTVVLYPTRGECECFGFKFRRNCAHIDEARALHDAGLGGLDG